MIQYLKDKLNNIKLFWDLLKFEYIKGYNEAKAKKLEKPKD
jgi:hypothetical protein